LELARSRWSSAPRYSWPPAVPRPAAVRWNPA